MAGMVGSTIQAAVAGGSAAGRARLAPVGAALVVAALAAGLAPLWQLGRQRHRVLSCRVVVLLAWQLGLLARRVALMAAVLVARLETITADPARVVPVRW